MLTARSSVSAIKGLHEGDLLGIVHPKPHAFLNQDGVTKGRRTFNNRACTNSAFDERMIPLVLFLGAIFRCGSSTTESLRQTRRRRRKSSEAIVSSCIIAIGRGGRQTPSRSIHLITLYGKNGNPLSKF